MRLRALLLAGACLAAAPAAAAETRPALAAARRWTCFYGRELSQRAQQDLDLAVLDPDRFVAPAATGPLRIAYVNAGEAEESRSYWASAKGKPYLVEENPDWPGSHRVDLRSREWRRLLLETVIPEALAKGYRGVFLDTLDTAEYLESKDPVKFAGSLQAARELVESIRFVFPEALILVNNGLPLLDGVGGWIDGVVVEDLYTRCRSKEPCAPTPEPVAREKEAALRRFREKTGKPVFPILYAGLGERRTRWLRAAVARSRRNGFLPYTATPELDRLGVVAP